MRILPALALLAAAATLSAASPRPNVIVIFSDDHGYSDLSCQGVRDDVRTPHIDSLAAGGVRMTAGYVTAPQCVPSRAGLLTGRFQARFGIESNGESVAPLDAEQTIAERLKAAGYATGMIGKWHLGVDDEIASHGFDDVYQCNASRAQWNNFDFDGRSVEGRKRKVPVHHIDACSRAARAFIQRHREQPFFLYLAYRAPHVPLDATPEHLARFPGEMPERRRKALAILSAVDDGVGGVLALLREHGLEENTLLFFIGDNGAPLKLHKLDEPGGGAGWDGSLNDPLNGEKGMLTEGGIRVPWLMQWKGAVPAGQVYEHPVSSLDVAATAVAAAGLNRDDKLDGVDLVPFLDGSRSGPPHEVLTWRWIAQSAIREGDWKYLRGGEREYLFNLALDAKETHNLLTEQPEIAKRLRDRLTQWAGELQPPGLATQPMASTWKEAFDFYLEGKDVPAKTQAEAPGSVNMQGWGLRNGVASAGEFGLEITAAPDLKRRLRPFLVLTGEKLSPPATATLRLRCPRGGSAGWTWRTEGQSGFPEDQRATFDVAAADEWRDYTATLPAAGQIIHLRLQLPGNPVQIQSIRLSPAGNGRVREYRFGAESQE